MNWFGRLTAIGALPAILASGCQQNTPPEYHTFRETQPESQPADSPADDQPLTAELEPEDNDPAWSWDVPASALEPLNIVDGSSVADIIRITSGNTGSANASIAPDRVAGPR